MLLGCWAGFGLTCTCCLRVGFGFAADPPGAWTYGLGAAFTAIGVADAGRLRPGTWTSFGLAGGAGESGGAAPTLDPAPAAGPWWPRCAATPPQSPASARRARGP